MDTSRDISILYRKMHMNLNVLLDSLGLSSAKALFLSCIAEHEPMAQGEICRVLDIDKSSVAKMLARLEKDGLVTKRGNPDDERSYLVELTGRAGELLPQAQALKDDWIERMTGNLTPLEKRVFFELLEKVSQNIKNMEFPSA